MDDGRIAEAQMHRHRAGNAVERAVESFQSVRARLVGMLLHPWLVDLHDIGAGGKQVLDLLVHRSRVVERHGLFDS